MPKVLRIINRFNLGGPTYNAANLTRFLPDEYQTLLIGGAHQDHEADSRFILDDLGVDYRTLEAMGRDIHWMRDWQALKAIGQILDEYQPDIIHTHASKAGALGRLAAHRRKVPVIVHTFHGHVFHSYFGNVRTAAYKSAERYLARLTDAIVAISPAQRDDLVHRYRIARADKVHVIPLGFDLRRFLELGAKDRAEWRSQWDVGESEIAVGIIGRLTAIKDHRFLFDVLESMPEGVPVRVFIIGGGELEATLRADAATRGLGHVTFCGWEPAVEKPLGGLDVVVLTSKNEGTPVSLIEAQAAGLPVISTDVGGVRDVVQDNRSGYLVLPNDTDDFREKLVRLATDESLRLAMGGAGRQFVKERFGHLRLAHDMENLYSTLLGQKD